MEGRRQMHDEIKLCFLDCESTGLNPEQGHEMWELAAIVREPGMPDTEHVWQIQPDMAVADPKALEIGRFHDRFMVPSGCDAVRISDGSVTEKLGLGDVLAQVQEAVRGAYLVGAVPAFDASMLRAFLLHGKHEVLWRHRLVCVETLVAGALRQPVPGGLKKAAESVGVPFATDSLHTALGDARLTRDVYDAVMSLDNAPAAEAS